MRMRQVPRLMIAQPASSPMRAMESSINGGNGMGTVTLRSGDDTISVCSDVAYRVMKDLRDAGVFFTYQIVNTRDDSIIFGWEA